MHQQGHVLITDDCHDCLYTSHAFTLLKLPLKKVTFNEAVKEPDHFKNAVSIISCKTIENKHKKQLHALINQYKTFFISFNEPADDKNSINGAVYFLQMPFSHYELMDALNHTLDHQNREDPFDFQFPVFDKLVGHGVQISKIKSLIKQVAYSDTSVLILGQSGTGKDVVASCIHYLSNRKNNPLVPINCGAIPSELMESELFGHEKGAFTGAVTRRPGRFEMANGGTLFLDEIGDMPLPMQVKLLRVLQERCIERVGGNASIKVDVRLIAATNQNLEALIENNRFREDLLYRINVFPIHVPSLSERADDIPLLVSYHLDKIYDRLKHRVVFTDRAIELLSNYSWPGNIRELANFLERMVILHPDCIIDEKDIDLISKKSIVVSPLASNLPFNIKEYMSKVEKQIIKVALEQSNGIINSAAEYLSMGRATLMEKIKKYNLSRDSE